MSLKEVDRLKVIQQVEAKQISQLAASQQLGLTARWVRHLQARYRHLGAGGLISRRRGQPSNNRLDEAERRKIFELILEHYSDFKPSFAHEKLVAHHAVSCSRETVRQIMIQYGLWEAKAHKPKRIHQQRPRRPCFGELVQIDGSPHDWFEGRAEACCLIVFIDDATSKLITLRFVQVECTQGYFESIEDHLKRYGRPRAYYSDRHSIFRVNIKEAKKGNGLTQIGRVCQQLGIELICARSPQAKGRVERANQTLQDRLIKEMRLAGINSIEQANAWLPGFIEAYNNRFGVEPECSVDAHQPELPSEEELKVLLSHQSTRQVSKQLQISYHNEIYQIQSTGPGYGMRKAQVTVCDRQGEITILYKGRVLEYKRYSRNNRPTQVADSKQLSEVMRAVNKTGWKPEQDHPWRQPYKRTG